MMMRMTCLAARGVGFDSSFLRISSRISLKDLSCSGGGNEVVRRR